MIPEITGEKCVAVERGQPPPNGNNLGEVVFTLRISRALNAKLIAEAEAEKRSRASQIVYLLEKNYEKKEMEKL